MIDRAAALFTKRLNDFLASEETAPEDAVVLMPPGDSSAGAAEAENRLVVFIANITQDSLTKAPRRSSVAEPVPVNLYLHLVVAANFEGRQYARGLRMLSRALQVIQAQPVLDASVMPEMADAGIVRLTMEMESIALDTISNLWGVLGGRYLPSVIFRVRTVSIDAGAVLAEPPEIRRVGAGVNAESEVA